MPVLTCYTSESLACEGRLLSVIGFVRVLVLFSGVGILRSRHRSNGFMNVRIVCPRMIPAQFAALTMFVFAALYVFKNRVFFCARVMISKGYSQNLFESLNYSRTPDERPPSPTTIPLIRPHFV